MDAEGSSQDINYESSQLRIGPHKLKPDENFVANELPFKGMFRLSYSIVWTFSIIAPSRPINELGIKTMTFMI